MKERKGDSMRCAYWARVGGVEQRLGGNRKNESLRIKTFETVKYNEVNKQTNSLSKWYLMDNMNYKLIKFLLSTYNVLGTTTKMNKKKNLYIQGRQICTQIRLI